MNNMNIKALTIHLARAEKRRAQVEVLSSVLPFPSAIVDAVDGRLISEQERCRFYRPYLYRPFYPFTLSDNEVACFLSHRTAWQTIVNDNLDAALILEDDAAVDEHFSASLTLALASLKQGDFIRFPVRDGREYGRLIARAESTSLIEPICPGLGMVAQLISRDAAIKLLKASERIDRPVDVFLQMAWMTAVVPKSVVPSGVQEISACLGGSTLKQDKTWLSKCRHEILRPIYRTKIARYAKAAARHRACSPSNHENDRNAYSHFQASSN
ncbi:glycosyltransferase family 25 protein [Rhizobium sp. SG741]|uniref:glycosyltransferase family 25 protein n=1 Tax=Rhizobium sp. SG741 TaxID=2587114 RepID=UPI0009B875B6|nr:glycosyltransferase family 25 protein [Rhizobium sp. SG741]NKJ08890.1 GR25 family glycosyltransferase involved in LPS biosynthesis [Rhizobium sp. SG741]